MNLLPSIVESYSYADMYNEFGGGNADKIMAGGVPVQQFLGDANLNNPESNNNAYEMSGGGPLANQGGPLANRFIPVGLGLISVQPSRFIEFEKDDSSEDREVIPEHIFEYLFGAFSVNKKLKRHVSPKNNKSKSTSSAKSLNVTQRLRK